MAERRTSAEFIVFVFVILVAVILTALTLAAIILAVFTDKDVGKFTSAIIDLTSTVIAALVGYLAGRSTRNGQPAP